MENLVGKKIENYEVLSQIGKGGMGEVYLAHDLKLDRRVAIKILGSAVIHNAKFIERFKREAKNQAQLSHPNIVTVYGFIEYHNLLGIVMEYVDGESLDKLIYRQKRLHIYDSIYITRQVLAGLGYAHTKGFVHRDIKPSNIILNKEGVAKIVDFGISKSLFDKGVTHTGAKIGTVLYMSPEQITGKDVTHRSDIYAVGCTLYEMLVGQPPFYEDNEYNVMDGHLKKKHKKINEIMPGTSEIIDKIVDRALAKDPNDRYNDCGEFQQAVHQLDKYLAQVESNLFTQHKRKPKSKTFSIIAFTTFIIAMIGLSYFVFLQVDALLKSDQINELKKYSFQSLFEDSGDFAAFSGLKKLQSGTNYKINSISFLDERNGFALGDSGTVLTTSDSGNTWRQINIYNKKNIYDGYFQPNGKSILVGDSSAFYFSTNFMNDFRQVLLQGNYTLFRINFIDDLTGFVLGNNGLIMKSLDGGLSWRRINSSTNQLLYDIAFVNESKGFIVGWNGTILKTTDRGETWRKINPMTRKYLKSIDFWGEDGVIVGGGGEIYKTDDGGENWTLINVDNISGLQKVKFINENIVISVGSKGNFIVSDDGGDSWKLLDEDIFENLTNLGFTPRGNLFLVGVNGTILKMQ
jgi:serine/threonine-protein kinase